MSINKIEGALYGGSGYYLSGGGDGTATTLTLTGDVTGSGPLSDPIATTLTKTTWTTADITDFDYAVSHYALTQFQSPLSDLSMNGWRLIDVGAPQETTDAATLGFVNSKRLNDFAPPDGDLILNGQRIIVLGEPQNASDASTKGYVDTKTWPSSAISDLDATIQSYSLSDFLPPTTALDLSDQVLSNVGEPLVANDAATKSYVDQAAFSASSRTFDFTPVTWDITGHPDNSVFVFQNTGNGTAGDNFIQTEFILQNGAGTKFILNNRYRTDQTFDSAYFGYQNVSDSQTMLLELRADLANIYTDVSMFRKLQVVDNATFLTTAEIKGPLTAESGVIIGGPYPEAFWALDVYGGIIARQGLVIEATQTALPLSLDVQSGNVNIAKDCVVGGKMTVPEPVDDTDATTKGYVDDKMRVGDIQVGDITNETAPLTCEGAILSATKSAGTGNKECYVDFTYEDKGYLPYNFYTWYDDTTGSVATITEQSITNSSARVYLTQGDAGVQNGFLSILMIKP